jgi:hypothetical protein
VQVTQAETALTKKPVLHPWRAHADGESAIQHTAEEVSGMKRPWAVHRKLPPAEALPEDEPVEEEPEVGDQEDAEETGKHTEQAEGIEAAQAEAQVRRFVLASSVKTWIGNSATAADG